MTITDHKFNHQVARDAIPTEFKWRITDLFKTDSDWNAAFDKTAAQIEKFKTYSGASTAAEWSDCLQLRDEISRSLECIYAYARLQRDADNGNSLYQNLVGKAENLLANYNTAAAFIEPELIALGEDELQKLEKSSLSLAVYKHYFANLIRTAPHILNHREETILAQSRLATSSADNIFRILTGADLTFPPALDHAGAEHPVSEGTHLTNMATKDRTLRANAFNNLFGTYRQFRNTFAASLSGNCRSTKFYADLRKFDGSLEASLFDDNIDVSVYNNLITTVTAHVEPLHEYIKLKKDFFGYETFHPYDLYVSVADQSIAEDFSLSYEAACSAVLAAVAPLGSSYVELLSAAFKAGWIDIYQNKGKRSGAYSWGIYDAHPYVLLNYQNNYNSISTLAHEMGHALHSVLSNKQQAYINSDYSIFCAEVASTTNEILLFEHLYKSAATKQKIFLINQCLETIRATLYRQVQFAEFEKTIHEEIATGNTLVADKLESYWLDLNKKYYGGAFTTDENLGAEWSRIPHFYTPFYVYKYATGYAAATYFANSLLQGEKNAQERYLHFLSSGGSKYPLELLKEAGVDLSLPDPLLAVIKRFTRLQTELRNLLSS